MLVVKDCLYSYNLVNLRPLLTKMSQDLRIGLRKFKPNKLKGRCLGKTPALYSLRK